MEQEANPYRDPADPPVQPAGSHRRKVPRVALTVGLTSFLAMAGAGAAFAVGGSGGNPSTSSSASSGGSASGGATTPNPAKGPGHGPGFFGHRGGFGPMGGMGPGAVVHGIFTVRNGTGYKTMEIQVGTVQSSNNSTSTKLVVQSADNSYTQSYTVQPSTVVNSQAGGISTVQKGDTVRVEAVQDASGFTATVVVDTTRIGASRQGFGFAPPTPPASSGSSAPAAQ